MKILHLNNEKTWRGGERQTLLLAGGLQRRGVDNSIACRPGAPLWAQAQAQKLATVRFAGGTLRAVFDLIATARHADLLHCHTGRSHSLAAATVGFHRKPVVVTRRVDFPPPHSWINERKYAHAAKVVCISEFIAAQLREWGVAPDKLAIIPSAVPPPVIAQSRAELRARLNLPADRKIIGNIAALVGHKDHATLLRAARHLCDRRKDVLFAIIGNGELEADLLRQRAQLGLEAHVRFLGQVPDAQNYLTAFDVFVMSSCMEGLGSIVLDAFAAGVPVAATAGGGLPELVRPDETGLLVPTGKADALANAINRLLEDEPLASRLRAAAQTWVRTECSVDRMTADYLKLYEQILRG